MALPLASHPALILYSVYNEGLPHMIRLSSTRAWLAVVSLLAWAPAAHAKKPHAQPRHTHVAARQVQRPSARVALADWVGETGIASYYSSKYHGRRSSDGSTFDQTKLTAAHPWLPFGTQVRVTLAGTGRSVVVVITDRLNSSRRVVDLSLAAAQYLGMIRQGVATVSVSPL